MRTALSLLAVTLALTLAGCNSPQDKAAENQADALERQAAATSNEALEKSLNARADAIEQNAGNADGGATTNNTPDTSPSK